MAAAAGPTEPVTCAPPPGFPLQGVQSPRSVASRQGSREKGNGCCPEIHLWGYLHIRFMAALVPIPREPGAMELTLISAQTEFSSIQNVAALSTDFVGKAVCIFHQNILWQHREVISLERQLKRKKTEVRDFRDLRPSSQPAICQAEDIGKNWKSNLMKPQNTENTSNATRV